MWFSGFRGAMAFALALKSVAIFKKDGQGNIMLAITLLYSIINIFINATTIQPILKKFDVE